MKTPNAHDATTPEDVSHRLNSECQPLIEALEKIERLIATAGHRNIPEYMAAFLTAQEALRQVKGGAQ